MRHVTTTALPAIALTAVMHLHPTSTHAQTSVSVAGAGSNQEIGAAATVGWQASATTRLGLQLGLFDIRTAYIAGFAVDSGTAGHARVGIERTVATSGQLRMSLAAHTGAGFVTTSEMQAEDTAVLATTALGFYADAAITKRVGIRVGTNMPLDIAISPTFDVAQIGNTLVAGVRYRMTDGIDVFAHTEAGGVFGYGGDGPKWRASAVAGIQWVTSRPPLDTSPPTRSRRAVAPFVGLGWRILGVGGHISHGPSFDAGIRLRWIKLGIAGFARPGPINGKTFRITPTDSQTYRGKSQVDLRSDGAFLGIVAAPVLPLTDRFSLEFPITLGQAAFGFYLTGDDRNTPDGRRVSEWENGLLDGRDAAVAFGIEGGVRATVDLGRSGWLQATAAAHYLQTIGYDAFVRDDYSGFSGALGVQVVAP